MTRDAWVHAHPWLEPVARFVARVEAALAGLPRTEPRLPSFQGYAADYGEGIPLVRSEQAAIDLEPGGAIACALADALAAGPAQDRLTADTASLSAELVRAHDAASRVAGWLLDGEGLAPSAPGLLRYLGWTAMRRHLAPLVAAFTRWRDDDRWWRRHCPVCGSLPAMAQLVGVDPARRRMLCCGSCGARWQFRRTACPFCEHDAQRLSIIAIESEAGLRIDWCEACRGYLKTCVGQGDETVLLADWTSLHLDVAAHDRGLQRVAASMYDVESLLSPPR